MFLSLMPFSFKMISRRVACCALFLGCVLFAILGTTRALPQDAFPAQSAATQTQGAVSTGGVHAAVLDKEKRPITAGGIVDSGPIVRVIGTFSVESFPALASVGGF